MTVCSRAVAGPPPRTREKRGLPFRFQGSPVLGSQLAAKPSAKKAGWGLGQAPRGGAARPGRPVRAVPVPMSSLRSPAQLREGAGAASLARAVARAVLGSVRGSARRGPQWWRPRGRLCPREPGAHPGCVRVWPRAGCGDGWPQAARQQAGLSVVARTAGGRDTRISGTAATATGSRFCGPGGEGDRPSVRRRAVPATRPAPTCPAPATLDGGASRNPLSPMDPLAFRAAAPMAGSAAALTGGGRGRACLLQEVWTRRAPPARPAEQRGVPPQAAALPDRRSPAETPSRPPRCCVGVWGHAKHIVVIVNAPGGLTGARVSV